MLSSATDHEGEIAVFACTEPSNQPTKLQVAEIAQMTHSSDALDKILQTLLKRLVQPSLYHWREIEHTLVVIQQCSFVGSLGFVFFFKDQVQAIAALAKHHFRLAGQPIHQGDLARLQKRALDLSQLLQDDERLRKERKISVIPRQFISLNNVPVGVSSSEEPLRGRTQTSWRDWRITPNIAPPSSSVYLPTPESSPERARYSVKRDHSASGGNTYGGRIFKGDAEGAIHPATTDSPSSISRDQLTEIANRTFESEQLDVLVGDLVDRLLVNQESNDYRQLLETLKILNHCLCHGSDNFIAWFRANRELIAPLCALPAQGVSLLANTVLKNLDNGTPRPRVRTHGGQRELHVVPAASTSWSQSSSSDSGSITLHESVKDLTAFVTALDKFPIGEGGYSCVYRAMLTVGSSKQVVAKKVLNSHQLSRGRLQKRLNREIHAWTQLSHPNIAPLYGITRDSDDSIGLISPFFRHGHIVGYIASHKESNINVLQMMHEIASGVGYLHDKNIVHGDIKGNNIMVDDIGHVKIIDFGVSRVIEERGYTTSGLGFSWAWTAPELLLAPDDEPVLKTKASDVYALAITFVEESAISHRSRHRRAESPVHV